MENQGESASTDAPPQQPQPTIPSPGYPPPQFQSAPPAYPPMYQQPYPPNGQQPGYFALPPQGLPASPYPLYLPPPRNSLAGLSIVIGALAGVIHFVIYGHFYQNYVHAQTRLQVASYYQILAVFSVIVVLIAIGAGACAIAALTRAKAQAWNGLIPAIVGLVLSALFLFMALDEIIAAIIVANAYTSLI